MKSADIGTGQVQSIDVGSDALTGADIAPGSVGTSELADGAVPGRLSGASAASNLNAVVSKEVNVLCVPGKVAGGGFVISGPGGSNVPNVEVQRSYPLNDQTWLVRAVATSGTPDWQLTGVATCAS